MGVTGEPTVAYLGWHGLGNLGDDAIYDAVRSQLRGATFLDLPRLPHQLIYATATAAMGLNRSLRRSRQLVGGGTLVGRSQWRLLVNRGWRSPKTTEVTRSASAWRTRYSGPQQRVGQRRAETLGTDTFQISHRVGARATQRRTARRHRAGRRGIRRSGAATPRPDVTAEDDLIGVNLGFGDDLWGHDPKRLADEVAGAVKQLASHGYRFVGILMNPADRRWTETALRDVPHAPIVLPADPGAAARNWPVVRPPSSPACTPAFWRRCPIHPSFRLNTNQNAATSRSPSTTSRH